MTTWRGLRRLHDEDGWAPADLSAAFGVTVQHVRRPLRGEQRPAIAGVDAEALRSDGVAAAVGSYLDDMDLAPADAVLATTARTLAEKLDGCATSQSAAAAQAIPRLSAELVDVLERLQATVPLEPDSLDRLRQRRAARLAAHVPRHEFSNCNLGRAWKRQ